MKFPMDIVGTHVLSMHGSPSCLPQFFLYFLKLWKELLTKETKKKPNPHTKIIPTIKAKNLLMYVGFKNQNNPPKSTMFENHNEFINKWATKRQYFNLGHGVHGNCILLTFIAKFQFTSFLEIVHKLMIIFAFITYFNYFISSIYMTIYDYYESSKSWCLEM